MAWLWAWSQYDYTSEDSTTTTETSSIVIDADDGIANYIGNDGDIVNGSDSSYGKENDNHEAEADAN